MSQSPAPEHVPTEHDLQAQGEHPHQQSERDVPTTVYQECNKSVPIV
jgi:hypothetical protein